LKQIASFHNGDSPHNQSDGDIYNSLTQQIIMYQPDNNHLEVAFKPKSGILPADPVFETIEVTFSTGPTSATTDSSSPQGKPVPVLNPADAFIQSRVSGVSGPF
jgi:hypothetical protein